MNFQETTKSRLIKLNCFTEKHLALYAELERHGIEESLILKIVKLGGAKSLNALFSLFKPLQTGSGQAMVDAEGHEISQWTRLVAQGFTAANLIAPLSHGGGSKNLEALLSLFEPLQSADGQVMVDAEGHEISQWTRLLANGFTAANLIALLSHGGGSKNLEALCQLLERTEICQLIRTQPRLREEIYGLANASSRSGHLGLIKQLLEQHYSELSTNVERLIRICKKIKHLSLQILKDISLKNLMDLEGLSDKEKPIPKKSKEKAA